MLKKDEAKELILSEFRQWKDREIPDRDADRNDGERFFNYLKTQRVSLLEFRSAAEKWQQVEIWLLQAKLVKR
jgi:hypothetical protein